MERIKQTSSDFPAIENPDDTEEMVTVLTDKQKTKNLFGKKDKKVEKKGHFFSKKPIKTLPVIPLDDEHAPAEDYAAAVKKEVHAPVPVEIPKPAETISMDVLSEVSKELKENILNSPTFRKKITDILENKLIEDFKEFLREKNRL